VPILVLAAAGLMAFRGYHRSLEVQKQGRGALSSMLDRLAQDGYSVNSELSGSFIAGTILQTSETDPTGILRTLRKPLVFKWADSCFKRIEPRSAAYVLEETAVSSSSSLKMSGDELAKSLPALRLRGNAISKYSLSFVNPRSVTYAKGDLSERFSSECVEDLGKALRREKPEAFAVVLSTIVIDEIHYEVEWNTSADAEARLAVTREATKAIEQTDEKGGVHVQVADANSAVSRISGKGQVVLAYLARAIDPIRGGANDAGAP
jgi:hypothetical protein